MNKETSFVRLIDDLGRVAIPKELRRSMRVETGMPIEIIGQEDKIILRKYDPNPIEVENAKLRRRLAEINNLAVGYEEEGPFEQQEAFDRIRKIDKLSLMEEK